jgi:DNA-binding transcriptional regulator YiaG
MAVKPPSKPNRRMQTGRKKSGRALVAVSAGSATNVVKVISVGVLRKRLKLKQPEFARLVPISQRSLATLESGTPPTPAIARRLTELQRLMDALAEIIQEESLGTWLQTPNDAFDGLKPIEVIDRGEADRLWEMIYDLRSGIPS